MFDSKRWNVLTQDERTVCALSNGLNTDALCSRLLINRGYTNVEEAKAFVEKSDVFFYNPFILADMRRAVDRIKQALYDDEKITIYGDYDVDGVTAVSILYMYLRDRGARIDYYIPTRENEGYGLNASAFDTIAAGGTKLVITVDTGITAIDEVEYAKSIGIDVVITDHHQCRPELPLACAVVNPKRPDCQYPFKELSGVGVVFKIICALELDYVNGGEYNVFTVKDICKRYIDLVTIGTIADVMPLVGENRIIVHLGLAMLQYPKNVGARALFRASNVIGGNTQKKITASTIGYTIAPRINAAGRIGSAKTAVELFLEQDPSRADMIAEELCATNKSRQETENEIYLDALDQIKSHDLKNEHIIVLSSDTWHHGVIGIVSSRITEKFGKPSVLISFDKSDKDEDGNMIGKGSARSVRGLNLVQALSKCSDYLVKFGGHELAAGLSVSSDKLAAFTEALDRAVVELTDSDNSAVSAIDIDAEITEENITEDECYSIALLEPYGSGNPMPTFVLRDALIVDMVQLSMGKHSKLTVRTGESEFTAIMFGNDLSKEGFMPGDKVDIVCNLDVNEFRNVRSVQLVIRDIDHNECDRKRFEKMNDDILSGNYSPSDGMPKRDEFAAVYMALKNESGKLRTDIRAFADKLDIAVAKLGIILMAMSQMGLLDYAPERRSSAVYAVNLKNVSSKVDIYTAPIMTKLFKRN
ncbi:MAG: single-stranded-DNA-specific exonuclease RecJ [Clostridia bacterium]|nr:single-stranded-DNA-specific exonuclease RecJ [Clostridia bacterium]